MGHAPRIFSGGQGRPSEANLDVYECAIIRQDPAWYSEEARISRMEQRRREDAAVSSFMPQLDTFLDQLNIENYISAPIVSDSRWKEYLEALPVYSGNAVPHVDAFQAVL